VVTPDSLSELIAPGQKHTDVALVSPVIYHYENPQGIQFAGNVLEPDREEQTTLKSVEEARVAVRARPVTLWGTALLLKRDVIDAVGYTSTSSPSPTTRTSTTACALSPLGSGPAWSLPPPCSTRPGEPWAL
jgi:GT2 family glycosyltransferase